MTSWNLNIWNFKTWLLENEKRFWIERKKYFPQLCKCSSLSNPKILASAIFLLRQLYKICWQKKLSDLNLRYNSNMWGHVGSSTFVLKLVIGSSVFKNVTWDQPRSKLSILNFEKNSYTFFLIIWLPWLIGSSKNVEHSNPIV